MVVIESLWLVFIVCSMLSVLLLWYLLIMMWSGCMCSEWMTRLWMVICLCFLMLVWCVFML